MKKRYLVVLLVLCPLLLMVMATKVSAQNAKKSAVKHYLYVATPGIRDYLGYGGHGILVFDIDNHHRFVKRITTKGFHPDGTPSNVKGIAVSVPLNSVFVSTIESLQRIDLSTDKLIWEKIRNTRYGPIRVLGNSVCSMDVSMTRGR